jgi:hypothetical protein
MKWRRGERAQIDVGVRFWTASGESATQNLSAGFRAVARKSAMVVKHEKFEKKLDISHYFGTFSLLWKH